jgi:hypothetical protein
MIFDMQGSRAGEMKKGVENLEYCIICGRVYASDRQGNFFTCVPGTLYARIIVTPE